MVTTVIDTAERIFAAFDIIDELTKERGLVTSETVPEMRAFPGHQQPGEL
jgi:PII-like signaling protein